MLKINVSKMAVAMVNAGISTSHELAEKSGVSVNTISRLRNGGKAKLPTLKKLAVTLGINPSDLIDA